MEEIPNNHLTRMKLYETWDILHINWIQLVQEFFHQ